MRNLLYIVNMLDSLAEFAVTEKHEPTPIRLDASKTMNEWGIPEDTTDNIREMTATMRYDRGVEFSGIIASRGGVLKEDERGKKTVVLPNFYDNNTSEFGQCADLSIQLLNRLHFSGTLDDMNAKLAAEGRDPVEPYFITGYSKTHFTQEHGMTHNFLGLLKKGADLKDMVIVDPSMQEISSLHSNGYKVEPENIIGNPVEIVNKVSESVEVGKYSEVNGEPRVDWAQRVVLSRSPDNKYVYTLGFVEKYPTGEISPIIYLHEEEAEADVPFCVIGNDGNKKWESEGQEIDPRHSQEVEMMLDNLKGMNLELNNEKAAELEEQVMTIKYT